MYRRHMLIVRAVIYGMAGQIVGQHRIRFSFVSILFLSNKYNTTGKGIQNGTA